ncbi:MAG: hypothetical protein ACRYFX_31665 [Janthinobacterium lividum]
MSKLLPICVLLLLPGLPGRHESPVFGGRIVYENEFQTLAGETLYFAVKPKNWLYIQGNNFKFYDRHQKMQQLYLGHENRFYRFEKGQAVRVTDTAHPVAQAVPTYLTTTATILGYRCQTLQLAQGGVSTLVYYSPQVRVKAAAFSRCPAPGWFALLQATGGALPLRTIAVDVEHDVTSTSEAISIQTMPLAAADFTITAPAR